MFGSDCYHSPSATKKFVPWYKERIRTKHLKNKDKLHGPIEHLNPHDWVFLKDGLYDFRDGYPPMSGSNNMLLKPQSKGVGPALISKQSKPRTVKQMVEPHRFTKAQVCYSKKVPMKEKREGYIKAVEKGLFRHPLALYPHLENSLDPEAFDRIVEILDPELKVSEDGSEYGDSDIRGDSSITPPASSLSSPAGEYHGSSSRQKKPAYKWKSSRKQGDDALVNEATTIEDARMEQVTRDFCGWVKELGGTENTNIEEQTIHSLFASGYETKPALSVPIHVVEMSNIPPELRAHSTPGAPPPGAAVGGAGGRQNKLQKIPDNIRKHDHQTEFRKFRYGKWYLPRELWQKRDESEPLEDPEKLKDTEISETKYNSMKLDDELCKMHGAKAFLDFLGTSQSNVGSKRLPEFMKDIVTKRLSEMDTQTTQTQYDTSSQLPPLLQTE